MKFLEKFNEFMNENDLWELDESSLMKKAPAIEAFLEKEGWKGAKLLSGSHTALSDCDGGCSIFFESDGKVYEIHCVQGHAVAKDGWDIWGFYMEFSDEKKVLETYSDLKAKVVIEDGEASYYLNGKEVDKEEFEELKKYAKEVVVEKRGVRE